MVQVCVEYPDAKAKYSTSEKNIFCNRQSVLS